MHEWRFEHSVVTSARREDAWSYWSDMQNHVRLEPGVERIELDDPFATGTTGRTIAARFMQEWQITEVVDGRRFVVTGFTPDGVGALSFASESVLNTIESPTGPIGFAWEAIVGPDGPIELRHKPAASSASSFPENLIELLPDYIPDDLDEMLPDIMSALDAAIEEIPRDHRGSEEIVDANDPAVKAARNAALSRTQLLEFLSFFVQRGEDPRGHHRKSVRTGEFDNALAHVR